MNFQLALVPALSLAAGVAILIVPNLLSYIVAAYLIAVGVMGLLAIYK